MLVDSGEKNEEWANDGRLTWKDHLQFILAFDDDPIIQLYRQSQEMNDREMTDTRNSEK